MLCLQHVHGSCVCTVITRCTRLIVNGHAFLSCFSGLLTAQSALQYLSRPPNHTHTQVITICITFNNDVLIFSHATKRGGDGKKWPQT